jgi:hypothetical protein
MIRDRGNKKWVSMMIPEHKMMLSRFYEAQSDIERPFLDEQKWEEVNQIVESALFEQYAVSVTYFKQARNHQVTGVIQKCDTLNKKLFIDLADDEGPMGIAIEDITHIQRK